MTTATEVKDKWLCDDCKAKFDYKFQAERCECWKKKGE